MSKLAARWRSALLWSVIAAAFIGPGTVTTAAGAGAGYGLLLVWPLLFSIAATMVLQEAAARLTLISGRSLGRIIDRRPQQMLLFGAIVLGCAAYQAGNLLGALAGLQLILNISPLWLLLPAALAIGLLWSGSYQLISRALAGVVALMGIIFVFTALGGLPGSWDTAVRMPADFGTTGALLTIGLIGTTIVPYNLLLATGLSRNQSLTDMRWGLLLSILIGGLITLAILLTGSQVEGEFSFAALRDVLARRAGASGSAMLAIGLFAAGFSSAITAPLAAAITGQALFGDGPQPGWQNRGRWFRLTWGFIFGFGLLLALFNTRPIPAIIAAQAVNGIILPLVAFFLLVAVNRRDLLGEHLNPPWLNAVGMLIVAVVTLLGLHNIWLAAGRIIPGLTLPALAVRTAVDLVLTGVILLALRRQLHRARL